MKKIPALSLLTVLIFAACTPDARVSVFEVHEYQSEITASYTSATVSTTIDPSYSVYQHRLLYSLSPSMDGAYAVDVPFLGDLQCTSQIVGLQAGATYYYQYQTDGGINSHYSMIGTFNTVAYSLPSVETHQPTSVTANAFVANAQVVSDGGQTVTEKGFCYATSDSPTISDVRVSSPVSGKGAYSCLIEGLMANTTYYYCAYAVNEQGVTYGQVIQVTTTN